MDREAPRGGPPSVPAPKGGGQRILYIDDDEAMVELVTRMLGRAGYRVRGFVDFRDALEVLRADPGAFDLAITDFDMPRMSGLDVAGAIREIRPDLPLAIASGNVTPGLRQQAMLAGVAAVISKADVVEELARILGKSV